MKGTYTIKSFCSLDLEFHTLRCRPFWKPRQFTVITIAVYIPLQANTDQALRELYGNIREQKSLQNTFNTSSTRMEIVYWTIVTLPSGTHTGPSPAHLSANRITLPFCFCLLIGRKWNVKHPPSGQSNAGRTNRTLCGLFWSRGLRHVPGSVWWRQRRIQIL